MNNKVWGQHLILDIAGCNENVCSKDSIKNFVKELVHAIDMVAYGEPLIEHFAVHSKEAAGYTLIQLIETSAITGHFSDNNRDAYLDIFSCKSFDTDIVIKIVEKYFAPTSIHSILLDREAKSSPNVPFQKMK